MDFAYDIKKATLKEVNAIFDMAKELAKMQDLLSRFCLTPASLSDMVNDPHCQTTTVAVIANNAVIGFAMFTLLNNNRLYHDGFCMYIDELFVKNEFRGHGVGKALFQFIANEALKNHCNRMEWWVEKNNHQAMAFYNKLGARSLDEFTTYRMLKPALVEFVSNTPSP